MQELVVNIKYIFTCRIKSKWQVIGEKVLYVMAVSPDSVDTTQLSRRNEQRTGEIVNKIFRCFQESSRW